VNEQVSRTPPERRGTAAEPDGEARVERPGDPCILVVFGATGDLFKRKLLPALYNLKALGLLPADLALVGVARRDLDDETFRQKASQDLAEFATRPVDPAVWADFRERLYCVTGDPDDPATFRELADRLAILDGTHGTQGNALFYLATPPEAFAPLVARLGEAGLVRAGPERWRRVVVEKPFGRDLESAVALNASLRAVLAEDQIFRIDHYLGKETVQNLLVFRFANGIFEPIWNRRYIDHVQITVAEELGVEGRGAFYERSGVLRDIIQNHIFQLLSLVAMEPPSTLAGEAVRNEKTRVLEAIRPQEPEALLAATVRGQYGEGFMGGKKVPAYRAEPSVSPTSRTETFAALRLDVENWRWAGVPFYVRSGKRLARRDTRIVVQFKRPPLMLFRDAGVAEVEPNRLEIRIQPEEAIHISMKAKIPGPHIRLRDVQLAFSYADFGPLPLATGYERLIYDAMIGDATLFHRADMVEAAWRVATPVLDLWASLPARDFPNYAAGSHGPPAADELLARDGRRWIEP
jgi:glucose-6-phosphate 1-dehydrogenase